MEKVTTSNAPAAIGPYSQAMKVGNLVFCSGQIPVDPATGNVPETIAEQAEQSCKNIKGLVEAAGSSMDKVVKTTCFLSDINDFSAFNEVYAKFFPEPYPARSCVEVARLPKDVMLEIEAIAEK